MLLCLIVYSIFKKKESNDEILRERKDIRKGWYIVRKDASTITTSLGDVTYNRTLFKNKKTGSSCYLLDKLIEIEPHTRVSEDAVARILDEAVDSTYGKGGANASIAGSVMSKETVMNKLHALNFPKVLHEGIRKVVETLYIDADEDARSEIYRTIHKTGKKACEAVFDRIIDVTEAESKKKAVETAKGYLLSNWAGIQTSMKGKDNNIQCSAEGHVSHIFADRMSSRPLGWSRVGCDKMARLCMYKKNGGSMLELVRYQAKELPIAVGAEEVICSSREMFTMENRNKKKLGSMADLPVYSIPFPQIKKIAALKNHIWGL